METVLLNPESNMESLNDQMLATARNGDLQP